MLYGTMTSEAEETDFSGFVASRPGGDRTSTPWVEDVDRSPRTVDRRNKKDKKR